MPTPRWERRSCWPRGAVVGLVAGLIAGCASGPHVPARASVAAVPSAADLDRIVRALAAETAAIRGLAFTRDVPVQVESPARMAAHIRRELDSDRGEIETERKIGLAMGVLPPGTDLREALSSLVGTEAQGYYDPGTARLVLSEHDAALLTAPGPEGLDARATVVHELVHALQHQHFAARVEDDDPEAPALSDASRGRLALLEGDATLVAMEWSWRRRGGRLLGAPDMAARVERWTLNAQVLTEANVPTYVIDSAEMPYEAGLVGVAALYLAGGFARIDAAIARVSISAAGVMHPEREGASAVEVPVSDPADAALETQGYARTCARTLGEMELRLHLGRTMRTERAAALAATWRGDRMSLFERGDTLASRWTIACEDAAHARGLADAFAPLRERWEREGCPGLAGGAVRRCPVQVRVEGSLVTIARGG
ncbi:MAG: hypothetical protein WCJ30_18360 [Deltaproteobacteria bacterium]